MAFNYFATREELKDHFDPEDLKIFNELTFGRFQHGFYVYFGSMIACYQISR
jgi:hypothetical protein